MKAVVPLMELGKIVEMEVDIEDEDGEGVG